MGTVKAWPGIMISNNPGKRAILNELYVLIIVVNV